MNQNIDGFVGHIGHTCIQKTLTVIWFPPRIFYLKIGRSILIFNKARHMHSMIICACIIIESFLPHFLMNLFFFAWVEQLTPLPFGTRTSKPTFVLPLYGHALWYLSKSWWSSKSKSIIKSTWLKSFSLICNTLQADEKLGSKLWHFFSVPIKPTCIESKNTAD